MEAGVDIGGRAQFFTQKTYDGTRARDPKYKNHNGGKAYMSQRDDDRKKRKKKQDAWLEAQVMALLQKSMKAALDAALDDLLRDWN